MPRSTSDRSTEKRFIFIDTETGERFRANITPERRRIGGRWVRVFQDAITRIAVEHPELQGRSLRVLLYVAGVVKWDNAIPGPSATATALGMRQPNVSRAYRELMAVGAVIERDGGYYLSPLMAWKGTERQRDTACRELFADVRLALPVSRMGAAAGDHSSIVS